MWYSATVTVEPTAEPVTLDEAKAHIRFVEAGFAVPVAEAKIERAEKKSVQEKRTK